MTHGPGMMVRFDEGNKHSGTVVKASGEVKWKMKLYLLVSDRFGV